eukprot:2703076-Pleurochrysis_carterae.AAC.1
MLCPERFASSRSESSSKMHSPIVFIEFTPSALIFCIIRPQDSLVRDGRPDSITVARRFAG